MKQIIKSISIVVLVIYSINSIAQSHKRSYTYTYDGMGNRITRTYALLTCPSCRTANQDSTKVADSLFATAQTTAIQLPQTSTEKVNFDGSLEVKNIYPNPTQGNFVVQFTDIVTNATVQLFDMQGNKMDEQMLSGREWQLDISLFPSGTYILVIYTAQHKKYTKQLVKI